MIELAQVIRRLAAHEVDYVIVGGVAATVHGSAYLTEDLDLCYARSAGNLDRLARSLASTHPRLRGAPADLPFQWDAQTLRNGLNFTLQTDLGALDLLGEIQGVGTYSDVRKNALELDLFDVPCAVMSLEDLIAAKRAAGRPKDLLVLPELEALLEARRAGG